MNAGQLKEYAAASYINPRCISREEFEHDYKTFVYFKTAFARYAAGDDIQPMRIALNHLVRLRSCFSTPCINNIALFYIQDPESREKLKSFFEFLSILTQHKVFDNYQAHAPTLNKLNDI